MITLYSTGCPQCKVLKQKLDEKGVDYILVDDIGEMEKKGFIAAPMLDVDGQIMNGQQAYRWALGLDKNTASSPSVDGCDDCRVEG